jgi:hypothetical protein
MQKKTVISSQIIALVAVFAALNVISDSIAILPEYSYGVWLSWNFLLEPITGITLGPLLGFAASLTGVMVGHYILLIDVYEFVFTIGAPIGAAMAALLLKGRWKPVLLFYGALFTAYFASPVAWQLPIWGMWDTYLAFIMLTFSIALIKKGLWRLSNEKLFAVLGVSAFVGLEADVLFRIFILVPMQTYSYFYGWDAAFLQSVWTLGAILTPLKASLATLATMIIGPPLLNLVKQIKFSGNH